LVKEKPEALKNLIINTLQNQKNTEAKVDKTIIMNNKAAKKLRRLSVALAVGSGKTLEDAERIYKNLKSVHKANKKAPKK
jgi:flagellar biosynthesis/type III secretory pathway M-ring protein FliF/YscJ